MSHRVDIRRDDAGIVVEATGELDAYVAPTLRARLDDALTAGDGRPVTLDLSRVDFLDSTALGAIVGGFRRSRERGRAFTVVMPRGHARRIFALTQLDRVLPLVEPPPDP